MKDIYVFMHKAMHWYTTLYPTINLRDLYAAKSVKEKYLCFWS